MLDFLAKKLGFECLCGGVRCVRAGPDYSKLTYGHMRNPHSHRGPPRPMPKLDAWVREGNTQRVNTRTVLDSCPGVRGKLSSFGCDRQGD